MTRTARELAETLGAKLEGDGAVELRGVASPERAGPHDLIYLESAKYAGRAAHSAALCIIAGAGAALAGKTVLRSKNPKVAFSRAAIHLLEVRAIATGIHPSAIVHPLAQIGAGVAIGPYAVIEAGAHAGQDTQIGAHCVIGAGCWIGAQCRIHPRVTLYAGTRLGDRVEVHSGAVIGADGFGYAFDGERYAKFPQIGIAEIGDDVEIGANTTIDRGSLEDTCIEAGVKLDNLVHVGHNVKIGAHSVIAAQAGFSGSCEVGRHVLVGGQAGFGERCLLEDRSVIGGQAGVLAGKRIRSGQTVWGTPARPIERFKEQFAWLGRLPDLAGRLKALEERLGEK